MKRTLSLLLLSMLFINPAWSDKHDSTEHIDHSTNETSAQLAPNEEHHANKKDKTSTLGKIGDHHSMPNSTESIFFESLIPIFGIIFTFSTPVIIVGIVLYISYRKRRLTHDTINKYLETGKDIPEKLLQNMFKETTPETSSHLHRGAVMVGLGIGVFLCIYIMGTIKAASIALIPLFIGIAQLLIWMLEKNKQKVQE